MRSRVSDHVNCWLILGALGCTAAGHTGDGTDASTGGVASGGGQGPSHATGGGENEDTTAVGGSAEPVPSSGVSTVAEFCSVFPHALAAYMARCNGGSADDWLRAAPGCGFAVRSEESGRVSLHVEQADLCLHGLADDACNGFSCSQVLVGTIPRGSICNHLATSLGDECDPGSYCPPPDADACVSVCSRAPLLEEGDHCGGNFNNDTCPAPLQCDADAICSVPRGKGETCRAMSDCSPGLHCAFIDEGDSSLGGSCQPSTARDGAPCTWSEECAPGYGCRLTDGGGLACTLPQRVGESCVFGRHECSQQCSVQGVCEIASGEGDPCGGRVEDSATGQWEELKCAPDLYCEPESSTCHQRVELGEACVAGASPREQCDRSDEGVTSCQTGACQLCAWIMDGPPN